VHVDREPEVASPTATMIDRGQVRGLGAAGVAYRMIMRSHRPVTVFTDTANLSIECGPVWNNTVADPPLGEVQEALRVPKPGTGSRFLVLLLAVEMVKPNDLAGLAKVEDGADPGSGRGSGERDDGSGRAHVLCAERAAGAALCDAVGRVRGPRLRRPSPQSD
jgi:hypothetical protein